MKILILAGGGGTRLWPLSTKEKPKQFYPFFQNSFFKQTIKRALEIVDAKDILVVTSKKLQKWVEVDLPVASSVVYEEELKDTLGAICQGIREIDDEDILVLSSDHYMDHESAFFDGCKRAIHWAESGYFCVFGKKPQKPHTGYGYIQVGKQEQQDFFVSKFVEKPDLKTANQYVDDGRYYWNLGMFCFLKSTFEHKLKLYQSDWYDFVTKKTNQLGKKISVDFGILEKAQGIFMISLDELIWSDVGSYDALLELSEKDDQGNKTSQAEMQNCKNNYIHLENLELSMIDMEDLIVVQKGNKLLVCPLKSAQKIKELEANQKVEHDYAHR